MAEVLRITSLLKVYFLLSFNAIHFPTHFHLSSFYGYIKWVIEMKNNIFDKLQEISKSHKFPPLLSLSSSCCIFMNLSEKHTT